MTVKKGLNDILNSKKTEYMTFEEGKPATVLFLDWFEDVYAVREHYERGLTPNYVKCPGKEVCPLCKIGEKYPSLKIKFRIYDTADGKVKVVSLAKSHVQSLNNDFNLDEIDPTQQFVKIVRSGKGATDTKYSARVAKGNFEKPNLEELDMPDLEKLVQPHSPEEIQRFIDNAMGATESTPTPDLVEETKVDRKDLPF